MWEKMFVLSSFLRIPDPYLLESPLDSKKIKPVNPKGNQPSIFIGRTEAEVPILWSPNVKSWHSFERTLILRKIEGRSRKGWYRIWWLDCITKSMDMSLSKLREMVKDRKPWCAAVHQVTKSLTRISDWTTTMKKKKQNTDLVLNPAFLKNKIY